ncbi:MAG: hypothetical protein ACTSRW_05935 [Candidatus Helarchaeota archaeon]
MMLKCPKCGYEWMSRKTDTLPKKCPRCSKRLDYHIKPIILEAGDECD